jgi:hypothetical protein
MNPTFLAMYRSMLEGVLSDTGYIDLVDSVRGEWYGFDYQALLAAGVENEIPLLLENEVRERLISLLDSVRARRLATISYPYAYATDLKKPDLIKVYDPSRCGSSCSTKSPDPWWIFSRIRPSCEELKVILPFHRKRAWLDIFG